jgi:hypothetical protein
MGASQKYFPTAAVCKTASAALPFLGAAQGYAVVRTLCRCSFSLGLVTKNSFFEVP